MCECLCTLLWLSVCHLCLSVHPTVTVYHCIRQANTIREMKIHIYTQPFWQPPCIEFSSYICHWMKCGGITKHYSHRWYFELNSELNPHRMSECKAHRQLGHWSFVTPHNINRVPSLHLKATLHRYTWHKISID